MNEPARNPWPSRTDIITPVELERNGNPLIDQFLDGSDGRVHKWHHYFDIYHRAFRHLRGRPITMLEIGVDRGGSLQLWKRYFGDASVIVGMDVEPSCADHADPERDLHVRIADQADPAALRAVAAEFGPFDVVLDDGGHTADQQITSFATLYLDHLTVPGVYMVEDTHTSYWPEFQDRGATETFMSLAADLVHELHEPYFAHRRVDYAVEREHRLAELEVGAFAASTASINFHDSVVWFERVNRALPSVEQR